MKTFCAISLLLVLFTGSSALAQTTFVIDAVPAHYTPLLDNIYLAPAFDTWNPGDVNYRFSKHSDGKYYLTFNTRLDTPMLFKFTRGDWARVEVTAGGADVANRSFNFSSDTVHFTIAQWHDMLIGTNTSTSNVNMLITNFSIPQLNTTRRLWVYLPSDYYTSGISYPVLYMQDAQNIFDALYSFAGEWKADESLAAAAPVRDCIVIGIDNGPNRIAEYTPFVDPQYGGGDGDKYMAFMVNTLKPFVDSVFRTLPQQEHTGIMGSSLGGLISLYGGLKYQSVFGRIGALSPSIWFDNYAISTYVAGITPFLKQKIYFTAGTDESSSDNVVNDVNGTISALESVGYTADEMKSYVFQGGQHSEYYWSQEFPAAYQWLDLWGNLATPVYDLKESKADWNLTNYNNSSARVTLNNKNVSSIVVSDELGRVLYKSSIKVTNSFVDVPIGNLSSGIYFFSLVSNEGLDTKKMAVLR